ncbi:MAG: 30S ribosomal protein S20 [Candidatus Omnitrophica bacterium CG07_land_8_20_14_0_80_50_8]|nr:MAG: 30S ribosomal protein S20 [Candidatus Omnitrophica bacterium CG07_land_8_20_14_0_80_50_8]
MAHRRSSLKKIRVDKRRRAVNVRILSELKTAARKVTCLLVEKKADEAAKESRRLFSKLDKAVKKGVLHKNLASRQKSRISLKINALTLQSPKIK